MGKGAGWRLPLCARSGHLSRCRRKTALDLNSEVSASLQNAQCCRQACYELVVAKCFWGLALKTLFRGLSFVAYAIGLFFAISTLVWIVLGITFRPSISYFEGFLNQKYKGYRSSEGRVIRCESWIEDYSEYSVSCRYFRQGKAEEPTYHAFDKWGGYIGSRDGG